MTVEAVVFYLFAGIALGAAIMVVTMRNLMYSAMSLLACFLSVAGLFFLQHAEFVGIVQVFVYGGGIMVLFLFTIMLVNLQDLRETALFLRQSRLAALLVGAMAVAFIVLFMELEFGTAFADPDVFRAVEGELKGNTEAIGWTLYRDYLLPFEIASVFLLVAMIGAVTLGRKN